MVWKQGMNRRCWEVKPRLRGRRRDRWLCSEQRIPVFTVMEAVMYFLQHGHAQMHIICANGTQTQSALLVHGLHIFGFYRLQI
jgi:hypothetical protein